ncbi:MAG: hypothetical protein BAJALOKI1v1_680015 [Promethearchaeota archaeon]|nr:MAG: hypothetical protein BAJALOKI1v1_680015 [Candidatus Lokiarchaeota archaeon]
MKVTQCLDDLEQNLWHYIRVNDFGFLEIIQNIDEINVNKDDILIHKQIKEGDLFPIIRYHLIKRDRTFVIEKAYVKALLSDKLVEFVKKNQKLPYACGIKNIFSDGRIQIDYTPIQDVSFSLKIIPEDYDIKNSQTFFEGLKSSTNPITSLNPQQHIQYSKNRWSVPSSSDKSKIYTVTKRSDGSFSCTCPQHIYRRAECKHIQQVKRSLL